MLRKKIPAKKGSWRLTGLKFKKQSLAAVSTQGHLTQTVFHGEDCAELPDYTVFLPSESAPIKGVPRIMFQPIGRRHSPSNRS